MLKLFSIPTVAQRKRNNKYRFDAKRIKVPVGAALYYADKPKEFRAVAAFFFLKRLTSSSVFDDFNKQSQQAIAKRYGVSHKTMLRRVKEMTDMGLCWRVGKQLRLISRQRFLDRNKAFLTKSFWTSMEGLNQEVLQLWMGSNVVAEKQIQCRYAELKKKNQEVYLTGVKKVRLTEEHLAEANPTQKISGQTMARMFGRTHHTTGLRKEKKLEKLGLLRVTRFEPVIVFDIVRGLGGYDLPKPHFVSSGMLLRGVCNKLEVIWRE